VIKIDKTAVYNLGNQLGLNKNEINSLIVKTNSETEQSLISMGPIIYPGTHYGTISIKDF